MPRLPTYSAKLEGGAISGGRRATAEDAGAVDITGAVRSVQSAAEGYLDQRDAQAKEAERLRRIQEAQAARDATIRGATVIAKGRNDFLDYLRTAGEKPISEVPDVATRFAEDFDKFKDQALENEEHPEGKARLVADLDNLRASLLDNAIRLQASRAGSAAVSAVSDVFSQNAVAVQKDPGQLERLMVQEKQLISDLNFPGLTDAQRRRLVDERRHILPGMAMGARIAAVNSSQQARALKTELESNTRWQELLSGEQYGRAVNALLTDIRQYDNKERAERLEVVRERIAERAAGVQNGLSLGEAGGDARLAAAIRSAENIGRAREEVKSMSYTDMVALFQKAQDEIAKPGGYKGDAAYLGALQAAAKERTQALRQDPAGYAVQNSNPTKKAFEAMVSSEFAPEAVRRYQTVATEAQRELGGPAHTPRLLPKSLVDQTVAEVAGLPPEKAANRMEGLQKRFGPMWTEVLAEMSGKLAPGYATIGRLTAPEDSRVRTDLAAALKAGPDLRKNLLDTDAKDVDRRVEEALQPYSKLVAQAGPGAQMVLREELAAARALAYQAVVKGDDPSSAAKKATNALVFDRYDIGDTYLAPKGAMGLTQREVSRIMRDTPATAFPKAAGGDAALSDDYRREAKRREAVRGYWANVTDVSTGRLGVEWRTGEGAPVILNSGERVRLFFDDLKSLPPAPRRGAIPPALESTPGGAAVRAQ